MKLTVSVENSETIISIDFPEELTLQDLTAYLQDQLSIESFIVFHNGLPLNKKESSLTELGLANDDLLIVKPSGIPAAPVTTNTNVSASASSHVASSQSQHPLGFYPEAEMDPIQRSIANAMEHNPESFTQISMLYIPVTLHPNGHDSSNPISQAFVDTGAQTSIVSPQFCDRIGITNLIDRRFVGEARGVGRSAILGRIHDIEVAIGDALVHLAFTVVDAGMDLLLGLDMMKKFGMTIDLRENCLKVDGLKVKFLDDTDIASPFMGQGGGGQKLGSGNIFSPGAFDNPGRPLAGNGPSSSILPPAGQSAAQAAARAAQGRFGGADGPSLPEGHIQQLVSLGFSRDQAIQALKQCDGNVEVAASLLFQ